MMASYQVAVLGSGPGGYVAAVRASQLGFKTALIEKENLGGTCLNWGCIPTKSLLKNAEVVHLLSKGRAFGFTFDNLTVDYAVARKRSRSVVQRQVRRIDILLRNHEITRYEGTGRLKGEHEIEIAPGGETIQAQHIIIATGSKPRALPGSDFDGKRIIHFRHALNLDRIPASALIVGAGPIGMEFATLWRRYGSKVTVVEAMPHALPLEDEAISLEAEKQVKRNGMTLLTETMVEKAVTSEQGVEVTLKKNDDRTTLNVETVLVSIGFVPNSSDLRLETAGVEIRNGNIGIDEQMRTNLPHIYAIGDVTGKMGLAHVASAQGMIAAETIAGRPTQSLIYHNIPRCTYGYPETASVGLTEKQAQERGLSVKTAVCLFAANGKALASDENFGFVKVIADTQTRKILGVHMIGDHVTELVAGPTGMLTLDSSMEELGRTVHPHPTYSESLMEAAHALCGHAIHS